MADALRLVPQPDLESRVKAMHRDGFVYFPSVINPAEVAELRSEMDRLEEIPEYMDRVHESWSRHFNNAFNRDEVFVRYLDKPGIIELAEEIHGERVSRHRHDRVDHGTRASGADVACRLSAD